MAQTARNASLFDRIGGTPAITATVEKFYERVLADPELSSFFTKTKMPWLKTRQVQFFTQALGGPAIYKGRSMPEAHAHLPIEGKHFDRVANHLVATLQTLGVAQPLIDEVVSAVGPLKKDIVNTPPQGGRTMKRGGAAMATQKGVKKTQGQSVEMARAMAMNDNSPINIMFADRDFKIQYMNPASVRTLKTLEQYLPIKVDQMIGQSIDIFHKNPAHQRGILADPKNLPHKAIIQVGPEKLDLLVSAIYDQAQNYLGAMVTWDVVTEKLILEERSAQVTAISRAQAVIEFQMDGTIQWANDNFLNALGYTLEEIQGKHHSMFVEDSLKHSAEYKEFWAKLNRGEYDAGEYKRFGRGGKEIWIQASYNPILDKNGKPFKVVKFATDVTAQKLQNADYAGQIAAIGKAQAVIEFNMDGAILTANDNFLNTLGYSLDEIKGRHHSMFVDEAYRTSAAYKEFWAKLNRGEYDSGEYKRLGRGGREIWIQASYNPILDLNGKPFKVVKFATDVTEQVKAREESAFVLEALAANDLTKRVHGDYSGDREVMKSNINNSIENLARMVEQIRLASDNIAQGANDISAGNEDLSQRMEEQASSLEETAASMEEMTSTVKQNADNAKQANQLSLQAREVAEKGGQVVEKAVMSMEEINNSSKKIADIIGVIDEIAFQTNLLALNAAVEAARAGEQGRGFAVVAAEVRNLAQRSAGAAKEIKNLIQDSVQKVQDGSKLVNQSGSALEEIVTSVKRVSDIIAEISAASQEQSAGIEQVNKAVMQLDQITQQNAALVEETSAASQSMNDQSQALKEMVGRLKLDAETEHRIAEKTSTLAREKQFQQLAQKASTGQRSDMAVRAKTTPAPVRDRKMPVTKAPVSNGHAEEMEGFEEF